MRPRLRTKLLAVVLGGMILIPGLGIPAAAHVFEETTSLSIRRRPKVVDPGDVVRFFGRLSSDRPRCERGKLIELVRKGSGVVGRDITNREGEWGIRIRVFRTGDYHARFLGTTGGGHPDHRHICYGDRSGDKHVRVR